MPFILLYFTLLYSVNWFIAEVQREREKQTESSKLHVNGPVNGVLKYKNNCILRTLLLWVWSPRGVTKITTSVRSTRACVNRYSCFCILNTFSSLFGLCYWFSSSLVNWFAKRGREKQIESTKLSVNGAFSWFVILSFFSFSFIHLFTHSLLWTSSFLFKIQKQLYQDCNHFCYTPWIWISSINWIFSDEQHKILHIIWIFCRIA